MGVYWHGCGLEFCNPHPTHTCDAGMAGFVMSWIRQLASCHVTSQDPTMVNECQCRPTMANPAHPWPLNHAFWLSHNHPPHVLNLHLFQLPTMYFQLPAMCSEQPRPPATCFWPPPCVSNPPLTSITHSWPPPCVYDPSTHLQPQHTLTTSSTCSWPPACIYDPQHAFLSPHHLCSTPGHVYACFQGFFCFFNFFFFSFALPRHAYVCFSSLFHFNFSFYYILMY